MNEDSIYIERGREIFLVYACSRRAG
jgi:hypothetical protein